MPTFALASLLLATVGCSLIAAHVYRPGSECPRPRRLAPFDMERFLGRWYVVQKSRTTATCLVYNITRVATSALGAEGYDDGQPEQLEEEEHYRIEQITYMQPMVEMGGGREPRRYKLTYVGKLRQPASGSSRMTVKFPLNMIGSSSFDVFATDYSSYAGVYSCQPLLFLHRQSATFMSRTRRPLAADTLRMLRYRLYDDDIDALGMQDISQLDCGDDDHEVRRPLLTSRPTNSEGNGNESVGDIRFPEQNADTEAIVVGAVEKSNQSQPIIWI